jgi:fatty acid synthase subunit beta
MNDSDTGKSLFIQFAGQGVKYMDDLRRIYTSTPGIRPFILDAVKEIKKQASLFDDSRTGFFEKGLDADRWIEKPETTPDAAYLLSSPLSHPFIFLTQISGYLSLILNGMDHRRILANTHSATGFSTGIVAAVLVSLDLPFEDLVHESLKVQAMFFWQGVRCQQSMLTFGVHPKLSLELLESAEGSPSAMASITNLPKSRLDEAISQFNALGTIYPAYELFPGRWIVSGLPDHLTQFSTFIKERFADNNTVFRFIPSTIGAHSPFLSYAFETSPKDARHLGVSFKGSDMKIPVWSNDTGEDIRNYEHIKIGRAHV